MCGIAGIVNLADRRTPDRALLEAMGGSLSHRGPDGDGFHLEPGVGFAHRRLSIIDVSGGAQPLSNEDGSVFVTYNGEIYNFVDLIPELTARGHRFRTKCDTEVVVHAWEEWGEACVDHFRGMFAFALWDRGRETLFLARDRLGIKPLHYALLDEGTLLFGSELKSLLVHPGLERRVDARAVEEYFAYGYIPEPRTILRQARKLSPGHTLTWRRGDEPKERRYWDVTFDRRAGGDSAAAGNELLERLREAVRIRLVSEVPLGAFLSGGVDSSAVVAAMAGLSAQPVNTCTIAFGEREFDETAYAQAVASRYRTNHQVERVSPDLFELVDRMTDLYDEPFADSSALPTYRVCGLARQRVTVALSGDGGDENLAGYRRYRWHCYEDRVRAMLPGGVRRPLFGALGALYPKADWAPRVFRAKATLQGFARDRVEGYSHSVSILGDPLRRRLLTPDFTAALSGYRAVEVLRSHAERAPRDSLSFVQYLDLKTYLVGDILTKVDRASMAHSLEVRVPLLDHPLVEWMAGLPPEWKLHGREGKFLFKRALETQLPREVLYRPKMGFAVPLASWFRGPLRESVRERVLGSVLRDTGWFEAPFLRGLVERHERGAADHSAALWALLQFEASLRRVLAPAPAPEAAGAPR
jgi:asparagine synthase (glutamine-hydrolysing)